MQISFQFLNMLTCSLYEQGVVMLSMCENYFISFWGKFLTEVLNILWFRNE